MAVRTCTIGVHGRNDEKFEEEDFQIIREARLESIKMMSHTNPADFARIKQENPSIQIITRLHGGGFGTGGHPSASSFVDEVTPHIQRLQGLCEWFHIHNEPNHVDRIEGWGATDDDARDFNQWYLTVLAALRGRFPWAKFIFPGLAVPDGGHRTNAWLNICRPAILASDAVGVHCYWQSPPDGGSVMMADHSGLIFKKYHELFPDKVLHILECGNSNGQHPGWPTDEKLYAEEYACWLEEVFKYPYIASTAFFMLSSPGDKWNQEGFTWRSRNNGIKHALVHRIANLPRPELKPMALAALAKPESVGEIGLLPRRYTHQDLINAFNDVWHAEFTDAMQRAGLDLYQLVKDRSAIYQGPSPHAFLTLSLEERRKLLSKLVGRMCASPLSVGQVTAQAGLKLRFLPGQDPVLAMLAYGTPVQVLHEEGEWLFVVVDADRAGYANRAYIGAPVPAPMPAPVPMPSLRPGPAQPGFLAADAAFLQTPMPAESPLVLAPTAGFGARTLARIWNTYGNLLTQLAQRLQIDVNTAVAVLAVESGGQAFGSDGRMIVRFENHLFYSDWGKQNSDFFFRFYNFDRETCWEGHVWRGREENPFQKFHGDQAAEWRVLDFSASKDDTAAKRSISMGAPQILGRNHQRIGYESVQAMFIAFQASDRAQILGLFDFIRTDAKLLTALRQGDFYTFAQGYNGPGQAQNYATLIQAQIAAFNQLRAPSFSLEGVALDTSLEEAVSFLPIPRPADVFQHVTVSTAETAPIAAAEAVTPVDERILEAWRKYTEEALTNNNLMFKRLLRAFIIPYYMTVAMYAAMFVVGLGLFITAVVLGIRGSAGVGVFFGGLSVVTFLTYFLGKPLRSLEENLHFITWLGLIYNTYWNRLLYMEDRATIGQDLEDATADAIRDIQALIEKSDAMRGRRPGLR